MSGDINFGSGSAAFIKRSSDITYSETGKLIHDYSEFLTSKGIKEGDYTGILLNNSPEFIAVLFALWNINSIPVLLNTKLTSKEIAELLNKSNAGSVITNNRYAGKIASGYRSLNIDTDKTGKGNKASGTFSIKNVVIFTSGASGAPKGVLLSGKALVSSIKNGNAVLNQGKSDRWLASLPFYHIGGLMIFLRAFTFGASLILPETLKLEEIKYAIENYKPTFASLVSTQLQRLIEAGVNPNPELRNVLLGGGPVSQPLIKASIEKGWPVSVVYGATETSSFVTYMPSDELTRNPGSSGRAVHPNKIEIIDSGVVEGDPSGEIVIDSPSLFEAYVNDADETNRKLVNGKYFTGDYGFLDKDNYLYVLSRRTDMIVSGGENIDPAEVEKQIMLFPGVTDVCVFGRRNDEWGEVVNAAITTEENFKEEDLTSFLKKELATYKIPKQYFIVNEIPRTSLGKIRREKIRTMFDQP